MIKISCIRKMLLIFLIILGINVNSKPLSVSCYHYGAVIVDVSISVYALLCTVYNIANIYDLEQASLHSYKTHNNPYKYSLGMLCAFVLSISFFIKFSLFDELFLNLLHLFAAFMVFSYHMTSYTYAKCITIFNKGIKTVDGVRQMQQEEWQ